MSSLSITAIIVIAAVCGGVAVLCITGLAFLLIHRRRQERFFDDLGQAQLNRHHDGDVDLRDVETYIAHTSQGSSPHWKRLKAHVYGPNLALALEKGSLEPRRDSNKQTGTRETSQGYRIVPNEGDADQIDLEPVEADELADIYLPVGKPEKAPLTPISERDTPDSSRRALPRQGYHLSTSSKRWHHLAQPRRNLSPSWFSDSSSASSNKLSKQNRLKAKGKAKSTTDLNQPRILRSLSFRSERDSCRGQRELPPSPDAIYDACSRLSPSPSQRPGKVDDRHGSDSDAAQTHSTKSSVFDGHGSYTTMGSNFPSLGTSSKRGSKRDLRPDTFVAESSKARDVKRFSRQSLVLPSSSSVTDICHSNNKGALPSSNQRSNQTKSENSPPVINWQSSVTEVAPTMDQPSVLDSNTQHTGHSVKRNSKQSFKFWRERTSKAKKISSSKKGRAHVLQEGTGNSNRRSLAASSTSLPVTNTFKAKKSYDGENLGRSRSGTPHWQRQKRTSKHKPQVKNSRPNSAATSTLQDADILRGSTSRQSILLPEIELKPLTSSKSSRRNSRSEALSTRQTQPIAGRETSTKHQFVDCYQEDLVGPSALWSIIGDQSDASESAKPEVRESPSAFSFEDSEDVLHLSHDRHQSSRHAEAKRYTSSRSRRSHVSCSPSRSSNETLEVKAPSPLRPRSSMLLADALPPPSRALSSPGGNPEDLAPITVELPHSLRIGNTTRIGKATSRQTSQLSAERHQSRESPSHRKSKELGPSRDQLAAASCNIQKLSRFTNVLAPPSHPPPPPPMTARNQARMTSMMMELRRQNSDSSRYDSSYFRLPRSQRVSQSSQRASLNELGIKQSSSRSSRSYAVSNEAANQSQESQVVLSTRSSNTDQSRSSLWDRRAGRERDPFVESGTRNYQNFSRPQPFVITSPNYLPGYEPESLSTQKNILEHLEQQQLIGQAVELGMSPEPILLLEHGRESSSTELHRTPTDESENDLSPMGKTIMAETRREQYGIQQRKGSLASTRTSTEQQWSVHSPPPLSPPHSQYFQRPLPRPSTSPSTTQFHLVRPIHHHRRNKSSMSSAGRSNSSGHNEPSQFELSSFRSWSLAEGRKSRRETQRQRVEMLKERVASMSSLKREE